MKLSVIGAGSSYTPELIDGIIKRVINKEIKIDILYLFDIDKKRLKIVGEFAKFMLESKGCRFPVVFTTSLKDAIRNVDFVLCQFRVGGNKARYTDHIIAKKYNVIGQETTGIGGFAKALRTIPVFLKIIQILEKNSPNAWIINFTNPVSIISQFLSNYTSLKWVGLCNVPKDLSMSIAKLLSLEDDKKLFLDYIGLNHLSWIRKVFLDGKDVTKKVLGLYTKISRVKNIPEEHFIKEVIESLQMIPSPYLLYYYNRLKLLEKQKKETKNRAEVVMEIEKKLFEIYKKKQEPEKPKLLEQRGGAYYSVVAVDLLSSIYNNKGDIHIVNVSNKGAIKDLESKDSIETNCKITKSKITPIIRNETLPIGIKGLIQQIKDYERLTVEAAVHKDKNKAFLALLNHPLVGDSYLAKNILEDIIIHNKKYIQLK